MSKTRFDRTVWLSATFFSLASSFFWLQIGLNQIQRWRSPTAHFLAEPAPSAPVHRAAQETALDHPVQQPSGITVPPRSALTEWQLRKAYTVSIPSLGIRSPVLLPSRTYWDRQEWGALEQQMQAGMLYGTVAYPHSSRPGAGGSLFIAGHSSPPTEEAKESAYGEMFEKLPGIEMGTEVIIIDGDERFTYVVTDAFIVNASDTRILAPGDEDDVLTLITCYPVGTTKQRFVVKAKLI